MIEVSVPHTGLLRLGLATDYSVAFWSRATEDVPAAEMARTAEEQGWFGDMSSSRVTYVVRQLQKRFPYPARKLLGFQPRAGSGQNALICHWHLQLNDPLYRHYTSHYLLGCWSGPTTSVTLDGTEQWVRQRASAREWKANTRRRMASGLMSAATEAGLMSKTGREERELKLPSVQSSDRDYLKQLILLAGVENADPYLASVGRSLEEMK